MGTHLRRLESLDQTQAPLLSMLKSLAGRADAPFHTPGHKRGRGVPQELRSLFGSQVFAADLPELPEMDNLFAPQGVIQQAQELAAAAFGAEQTWFLANGSTCGVIAAILAVCQPGDKIILPRNVHYSAISGLVLSGAIPIFVMPEYDADLDLAHGVTPAAVQAALAEHPDVRAVMLVYPTYYGVCGDIVTIAQLCHRQGVPLLVDEAHAAHFAFHPDLPAPALSVGADLVVQSTHKTLSALTQAAMLHVQGDRINRDRLSQSLALVQSTSPSYLLLASLDAARQQMATQGRDLMQRALELADTARSAIDQISGLATLNPEQAGSVGFWNLDRTRLTVIVTGLGMDGFTVDELLCQQGVIAELPALHHLTFIITAGTTGQDIERLVKAFVELAKTHPIQTSEVWPNLRGLKPPHSSTSQISPRQAFHAPTDRLPVYQTIGRISAELICPYPPGIPVLIPGEVVTEAAIAYLQQVLALGGTISGSSDPTLQTLKVVQN